MVEPLNPAINQPRRLQAIPPVNQPIIVEQLPVNYLEESSKQLNRLYRRAISEIREDGSVSTQTTEAIQRLIASYRKNTGIESAPPLPQQTIDEFTTLLQRTGSNLVSAYLNQPRGEPGEDGVRRPATPQQIQEHQNCIQRLETLHTFLRSVPDISSSVVLNELSTLIGHQYFKADIEITQHEFPRYGNAPFTGEQQTRDRLNELRTEYTALRERTTRRTRRNNPETPILPRHYVELFYRGMHRIIGLRRAEESRPEINNPQLQYLYSLERLYSEALEGQDTDGISLPIPEDND